MIKFYDFYNIKKKRLIYIIKKIINHLPIHLPFKRCENLFIVNAGLIKSFRNEMKVLRLVNEILFSLN